MIENSTYLSKKPANQIQARKRVTVTSNAINNETSLNYQGQECYPTKK